MPPLVPKEFTIRRRDDGFWVPADPSIEHLARFMQDDTASLTQIRYYLFAAVDALMPGEYTLNWELTQVRQDAFARIDHRSDALIASGFRFRDVTFSLSTEAQIRYTAMLAVASYLTYPIDINSLDDVNMVSLATPTDTLEFCMTALAYVKGVVDSGTVQKNVVRALVTVDELAQYVDPR